MSPIFQPVTLTFSGKKYVVAAADMMKAIEKIEDHVSLKELASVTQGGSVNLNRLSQAYAAVLQFAGCRVNAEEVYVAMFHGGAGTMSQRITAAVSGLLQIVVPPSVITDLAKEAESAETKKPAEDASSGKRRKARAARAAEQAR